MKNKRLKILKAQVFEGFSENRSASLNGSFDDQLVVKCKKGFLRVIELKPQGKKKMTAKEFLNGYKNKEFFVQMNQRVKLIIEYDGTNYVGWQNQRNQRSIQGEIEKSLKKVFNQTVIVYGAGRTDAGVHALKQVAHFDLDRLEISEKNFARVEFLLKKRKKSDFNP